MGKAICKHCGGTDLEPDPAGYYNDAERDDGAPLLCVGLCKEFEGSLHQGPTRDEFLKKMQALRRVAFKSAYALELALGELGEKNKPKDYPEQVHPGPCTPETPCDMDCAARSYLARHDIAVDVCTKTLALLNELTGRKVTP